MISDTEFDFINSCIWKFESASFTNENDSKFNFPSQICKVKYWEKSGFVIAIIPFYPINIEQEEPCLYGTIRFYQKSSNFYLTLKGMGKVIRKECSPNYFKHLSEQIDYPLLNNELLFTFYINAIDYVEVVSRPKSYIEDVIKRIYKLFNQKPPHYRNKNIHSIHYNWG